MSRVQVPSAAPQPSLADLQVWRTRPRWAVQLRRAGRPGSSTRLDGEPQMSHSEKPRVPSYRHHKATGQARVTIEGRDHYLGKFGTAESRARYQRLIVAFLAGATVDADTHRPSPPMLREYPVARLCGDFLDWAK